MQYLVASPKLDPYVQTTLAQLMCRITKLGWFDSDELRTTMEHVVKLMRVARALGCPPRR